MIRKSTLPGALSLAAILAVIWIGAAAQAFADDQECIECRQDMSLRKAAEQIIDTVGREGVAAPAGQSGKVQKRKSSQSSNFLGSYDDVDYLLGHIDLPMTAKDRSRIMADDSWYSGPIKGVSQNAKKDDGVERRTPSALLDQVYLDSSGRLNAAAVERDIAKARDGAREGFVTYCMEETKSARASGSSDATAYRGVCESIYDHRADTFKDNEYVRKWKKKKVNIGYQAAESKFQQAIDAGKELSGVNLRDPAQTNSEAAKRMYGKLFEGLEILEAAKNEDVDASSARYNIGGYADVAKGDAFTISSNRVEASNLLRPGDRTGRDFLSLAEVNELKKNGYDLSELQIPDSGLYRNPTKPISSFNVVSYDGLTEGAVGKDMNDPDKEIVLEFSDIATGGNTPKFEVKNGKQSYKLKYLLPLGEPGTVGNIGEQIKRRLAEGSEVYTENIVNPLMAAVGFTIDPTYFKKKAKVYLLPPEMKKEGVAGLNTREKIQAYNESFETQRKQVIAGLVGNANNGDAGTRNTWDYSKAFPPSDIKTDELGRKYIEMDRVSLELKSGDDTGQKIGLFHKETNGRILFREHRCLAVASALFADDDAKDANADIKLVQDAKGEWKAIRSASDMGATFSSPYGGKGMPNYYKADMVDFSAKKDDKDPGRIVTTFVTHHQKPIFDAVTTADLRWCLKRFDQLSDDQIMDSMVKRTDMPAEVAVVMKDKILRRLDQFNQAAGLVGAKIRETGTGRELAIGVRSQMRDVASYVPAGFDPSLFKNGNVVRLRDMSHPLAREWTKSVTEDIAPPLKSSLTGMAVSAAQKPLRYFGIGGGNYFGGEVRKLTGLTPEFKCLPTRVQVENPNKDPNAPYWVMDTYQFVVGGRRGGPSNGDGAGFLVKEVVRIHATKDPNALATLPKLLAASCNPRNASQELSEGMLGTLEKGDVLMFNEYKVGGLSVKASPAMPGLSAGPIQVSIGPTLTGAVQGEKIASTVIMKGDDSRLMVAHRDQKQLISQLTGNVQLPLIHFMRFPVFGIAGRTASESQQAYNVDLSELDPANPKERKKLLEALTSDDEKKRGQIGELLQERSLKTKGHYAFLSFLGLATKDRASESVAGSLNNHETGDSRDVMSEIRRRSSMAPLLSFRSEQEAINASLVDDRASGTVDLGLKIDVNYSKQFAHREDLKGLQESALKLFPTETVPFAADKANVNLGGLLFNGSIQFSQAALERAFASKVSADEACKVFESKLPIHPSQGSFCEMAKGYASRSDAFERLNSDYNAADKGKLLTGVLAAKQFQEDFAAVQSRFTALSASSTARDRDQARSALRALANSVSAAYVPDATVKALQQLAGPEGVCRDAELSNTVKGFPGQADKVSFRDPGCGEVQRSVAGTRDNLGEMESDKVFQTLQPYMFNYFSEQRISDATAPASSLPK